MLPVYQCHWQEDSAPTQKITNSLCSWSIKNWIAYTNGYENESEMLDINTVYIMNPDMPWETYPINTGHERIIEHLEWDHTGEYLLTVDQSGVGKIWNQDKSLINSWTCLEASTLNLNSGGRICKISWLNFTEHRFQPDIEQAGKKEWYNLLDKKNLNLLTSPHQEENVGFVMVTSEGLVKLHFLNSKNNRRKQDYVDRLGTLKSHIITADFVIADSGKLFVAAVTDPCMVELFSVNIKDHGKNIDITEDVWPCIVPAVKGEANYEDYEIVSVKCIKKCNPNFSSNQVAVLTNSANSSAVRIYEIKKEQLQLHSRFQSQSQPNQLADTCSCLATIQISGAHISHISVSDLHYSFTNAAKISSPTLLPKLVFLDSSGTLHLYSLMTFKQLSVSSNFVELQNDCFDSSCFSPSDHALFTVTNKGTPTLLTLSNQLGQDNNSVQNTVTMLQCCMAESRSPWDIFLHISTHEKPFIDRCFKQFLSEYAENDSNTQSLFFQSFCHFKALFFASLKDYKGVFESYYISIFYNVYFYLTSMMQSEKEITLLEKIHNICVTSKKEFDLNKVAMHLEVADFAFTKLNSLVYKPMLQWVADYLVHLVRLLLSTSHNQHDWKVVFQYFDPSTFLIFRKTLVLLSVLYMKTNLNIQPIYVSMINSTEVVAQLFKMVSKLYVISLGEPSAAENFLAELPFSSLPMMYLAYPMQDPKGTVLSQNNFNVPDNIFCHYDIQLSVDDWEVTRAIALTNPLILGVYDVYTQKKQIFDGVRFIPASLVAKENVKQCCRCGIMSIFNCPMRASNSNDHWVNSWSDNCICGGKWKKIL